MGDTNSPGYQFAELVLKDSSPDMLWVIRRAQDVMEDPNEPLLFRLGAFLVGSYAIGQGFSDVVNIANGQPREWIFGESKDLPPREAFVSLLQRPPLPIQLFPPAKNIFVTPTPTTPARRLPSRPRKKGGSKRRRTVSKVMLTQSTL